MPTISEALAIATQHHQAGRLQAAEQIYRQILALDPRHPQALHLLGVIAQQQGNSALAAEYIEEAIRGDAGQPLFHNNLGEAYRSLRRTEEAIASYRRRWRCGPSLPAPITTWATP